MVAKVPLNQCVVKAFLNKAEVEVAVMISQQQVLDNLYLDYTSTLFVGLKKL